MEEDRKFPKKLFSKPYPDPEIISIFRRKYPFHKTVLWSIYLSFFLCFVFFLQFKNSHEILLSYFITWTNLCWHFSPSLQTQLLKPASTPMELLSRGGFSWSSQAQCRVGSATSIVPMLLPHLSSILKLQIHPILPWPELSLKSTIRISKQLHGTTNTLLEKLQVQKPILRECLPIMKNQW